MIKRHVISSLLIASALSFPFAASASTPEIGRLSVTASSDVVAIPDTATVRASLWERTPSKERDGYRSSDNTDAARDARETLETRMADLITSLEALGIPASQLNAGSLTASEVTEHTEVKRDHSEQRYRVHTRVERPLAVTTMNLDLLPSIIDALSDVGINAINGVDYSLSNRDEYYNTALANAVAKAQDQATLMADGLDSQLVRVLNVQKDNAYHPAPMAMMRNKTAMDSYESGSAEYRAGEMDIEASVTITWEIDNAE